MQKVISFMFIILFACLFLYVPSSFSGGGKDLFQSKCGKCHAGGGEAPVFAPVKYASSQWERFFSKNKHARKKDISGEVSAADLDAIKQFLISHAADSDRPQAAGLR